MSPRLGSRLTGGATFVTGISKIAEPPVNDLWTIPGEEHLLPQFETADQARFERLNATTHYHALQIQDFLRAIREGRSPLVTGEDGRAAVETSRRSTCPTESGGRSAFLCNSARPA